MAIQARRGRELYAPTRRVVLGGAVFGGTGMLLAACGAVSTAPAGEAAPAEKEAESKAEMAPKAEPQVLRISNYHSPEDARWTALSQTFAEGAEALGITIETPPEYREVWQKRTTEFAAGTTTVDITYNQNNWALTGGLNGMFVEKFQLLKSSNVPVETYFAADIESWSWRGKLYALPFQSGGEAVMYNKHLFDQKGVPYPHKDWTYDEFLDACVKLTNPDDNKWAVSIGQNGLHYMAGTFVYNFGGQLVNEDRSKAVFGEDQNAIRGFRFDVDLHIKHQVTPPAEATQALPTGTRPMESEMIAMEFNGIFRHNTIKAHIPLVEKLDFAPPPRGMRQTASLGGNAYSILSFSPVPDLAWDFLMWFHSEEGLVDAPQFDAIAWPPTVWASNHPKWLSRFEGTKVLEVANVWETDGHDRLVTPETSEAWQILRRGHIQAALNGEIDAAEAMRLSAQELNELYSRRPEEWR